MNKSYSKRSLEDTQVLSGLFIAVVKAMTQRCVRVKHREKQRSKKNALFVEPLIDFFDTMQIMIIQIKGILVKNYIHIHKYFV